MANMVLIRVKGDDSMEDDKIVDLYLNRDQQAIPETTAKYGQRIREFSYGIVCNNETAEECESDTYLEAWNRIPPNEPRTYFYAYLLRIARHISLNRCRENRALKRFAYISELSSEMEACIPGPDDLQCRLEEKELADAINGFLSTLVSKKRSIFLRRYFFGDDLKEISKRFGIKQNTAKTILFRCRNQLREYLIKEGYDL